MKIPKRIEIERAAMKIAQKYNMVHDYKVARRHGFSPKAALEDWDIYDPIEF